ncbi:phosphatase PAP2 family protein [Subtercola boreus]|uniref:Phosphatidic acid phosphatase type 2/haloperoxidase domain-containing protein n=1 Tax=Subtercola boreus TaxID=120213 RepID=A0A3E0WDW7_9MICO|nr:phosphatase PAP2 family protein [Subtercola boreus]RFA22549.1 hypothetical protein B7R24_02680 [Subtercola boreus]RFA22905.1 hypothetical protein B7R23_02675 [Subtercola boreus]RFA28657.1 hypothetical protein B7R25_02690 [Subtercola boreus]
MTTLRAREIDVIVRVQGTTFARAAVPVGKALSLFGEHAAGWIVLGLIGAVLDLQRVMPWLVSVGAVIVAHGLSVVIKRFVRRPRPGSAAPSGADGAGPGGRAYRPDSSGPVIVYAKAPSKLSFPSSHASSTMAAAIVYTALVPALWPVAVLVVLAMGYSRIILGMHFVTDVLAGFAIGLIVGLPTVLLLA